MSGALDSGMDIVLEVSSGFILRILRKKLVELDQGCFEADGIPVPNPLDPDTTIPLDVRRVQFVVEDVSFEQTLLGPVFVRIDLRLLYGQAWWLNEWKSLDELEDELQLVPGSLHAFRTDPLQLDVSAEADQVMLSVDTTSVDYLPADLTDLLGESIPIPISFLNQTQEYQDEAGADQVATLLAVTISGAPMIKRIGANSLAIGIDVELSQDDDLKVLGPGVSLDADPVIAGPGDLVSHGCGLPSQPFVDRLAFDLFNESFAGGHHWAVALDAHIVDAMLRGTPAAGMNDLGEETADCAHTDALRSMCLVLDPPLAPGVIHVRGGGEAYICTPDWLFFVENDYYGVEFTADVTLSIDGGWVRAHYEVTSFSVPLLRAPGPDLTDLALSLAGEDVPASDDLNAFRGRFGESDDPAGRLTVEEVEVLSTGLVLRGSSNVGPKSRSIDAADELLFSTGCQAAGEPSIRRLRIRNTGQAHLHLCPLAIREHPDGNPRDVGLFTVTSPEELIGEGTGLTLAHNESTVVEIACSGNPGGAYVAWLDIPNDADRKAVRLDANFLPAALGPVIAVLDFGLVEYEWSGCDRAPDRFVAFDVAITNDGPGHMRLCTIRFSQNVQNVFSATDPGTFAAGTTTIRVTFSAPWGENRTYDGTLRIVTNSGEDRRIRVIGQVTTEDDPFGVFNHAGFGRDFACGDADWDRVQDTGGRILDTHEVADLLPILGGEPCCPPPRGPACRCVDLWETSFIDVPPGVRLEVLDSVGQPIASNVSKMAHSSTRTLVTPFRERNNYALRARLPKSVATPETLRVTTRRWLLQQDGLYTSRQRLSDVAIVGEFAYAVGERGVEVISLANSLEPTRVALSSGPAGATSVAAIGEALLVGKDGLRVYSLANPAKPKVMGRLTLGSDIKTLLTTTSTDQSAALVYAAGQRLHVLDLSALGQPKEINAVTTRVHTNRMRQRGKYLFLFGKNGMQSLDVSKPDAPKAIGFLRTKRAVRNAVLAGSVALLVYDGRDVDMVDVSEPSRPQLAGHWRLETWMREYVPIAGSIVQDRHRFLALTADQRGCRLLRLRANAVDREKLRIWRARTRTTVERPV